MLPCFLNFGAGELVIIFIVILLLFGAKRIPDLARSMGKGISMFKQGMNEAVTEIKSDVPADSASAKAPTADKSVTEASEK